MNAEAVLRTFQRNHSEQPNGNRIEPTSKVFIYPILLHMRFGQFSLCLTESMNAESGFRTFEGNRFLLPNFMFFIIILYI